MQIIFASDPDHSTAYGQSKTWILFEETAQFAALARSQP